MTVETFDVVIVGSGFGGAVMAYRLAEAGQRVCLLERGRAYPPGAFPRDPHGFSRNFWDPSKRLFGMFDIWSFRHLDAVIASGLGGGSLIYANVLIRKDERWFVRRGPDGEDWPVTRADLDPHYDEVERRIGVARYPLDQPQYKDTTKTHAFLAAGRALGYETQLLPLAVSFGAAPGEPVPHDPANLHGRPRSTCRLCGECWVGCNFGAKNSLDHTYLSQARRLGADVRTLCEVKALRARTAGRGYAIDYVEHDPARSGEHGYQPTPRTIVGETLVLSAGALGTPYLLLKNRHHLRGALPPLVGHRVGGNGDMLTFATSCRHDAEGRPASPGFGPTITAAIRKPDALDGGDARGRGGYLEDAGFPAFIAWLAEFALPWRLAANVAKFGWLWWKARGLDCDMSDEVTKLFGPGAFSSTTQPLLGMGRDVPDGVFSLDDEERYLRLDWKMDASEAYFEGMTKFAGEVAGALGGGFAINPTSWFRRGTTVHPLGGCVMGATPATGAVDPWGRLFGVEDLIVADGSVVPGPVGPNPSLTIAALADRFATRLLGQ